MNTEQIFIAKQIYDILSEKAEQERRLVDSSIPKIKGCITCLHLHGPKPILSIFQAEGEPLHFEISRTGLKVKKYGSFSKVDAYIFNKELGFE